MIETSSHWRIQHYCKIHGEEQSQRIYIKLRHNVLLMISSENVAVPLYTPLNHIPTAGKLFNTNSRQGNNRKRKGQNIEEVQFSLIGENNVRLFFSSDYIIHRKNCLPTLKNFVTYVRRII